MSGPPDRDGAPQHAPELLAADAGDHVAAPHSSAGHVCDLLQNHVADAVAPAIFQADTVLHPAHSRATPEVRNVMSNAEQPFTITEDPARRYMRADLAGHWDMATIKSFDVAARQAIKRTGGATGASALVLIDARASGVQSQNVVQRLQTLAGDIRTKKTAVLVPNTLSKLQAHRINPVGHQRVFASEDEALEWLFAPGPDAPV
jgi:hypothetical protein